MTSRRGTTRRPRTRSPAWLDQPRLRSGTRVTVRRRNDDGNVLTQEGAAPQRVDAHVWHCSLSLHPEEPALSDQEWQRIAEEFVLGMGFDEQRCRWLALRHGASAGGNDHVHVVVQLVGETGHAAKVHNDRPRAQERCRELEQRHGLRQVEGRQAKRGARATSYRQRYRAEREHEAELIDSPKPDRDQLEAKLRVAGAGAGSEAEFVRMLRADGLLVRPRFAAGRDDEVVGYSVALAPAAGRDPVWHAGGKVAKDLTLPRLRSDGGWTAQDPEAIEEWQRAFRGDPPARPPAPAGDPDVQRAVAELRAVRDAAAHDPAAAARTGAACFYGWAQLEPELAPRLELLRGRVVALRADTRGDEPSRRIAGAVAAVDGSGAREPVQQDAVAPRVAAGDDGALQRGRRGAQRGGRARARRPAARASSRPARAAARPVRGRARRGRPGVRAAAAQLPRQPRGAQTERDRHRRGSADAWPQRPRRGRAPAAA